jgi:uncharacterized protein YndB with AHSA1/START domain
MDSTEFRLVTDWLLDAPIEPVWAAIGDVERWPGWWPSVRRVDRICPVGAAHRLEWRTALPYSLSFEMEVTRIEPLALIEGRARGELDGTGRWTFAQEAGRTRVRYEWSVAVTKSWMRRLAPVLRPIFAWNHNVVMERGRRGLERLLAAQQ